MIFILVTIFFIVRFFTKSPPSNIVISIAYMLLSGRASDL